MRSRSGAAKKPVQQIPKKERTESQKSLISLHLSQRTSDLHIEIRKRKKRQTRRFIALLHSNGAIR